MRKVLLALVWIAVALLVAFNVVLLWGTRLPREHVMTRAVVIHQPVATVWQTVTDFNGQTAWRPDLKSVERLPDRNGMQLWRETQKGGEVDTYATEQMVPPLYLVRTIADERSAAQGSWEFSFQGGPGFTTVQLTERGSVKNPFYRFVAAKIFRYNWIDDYLKNLAVKFKEQQPKIS